MTNFDRIKSMSVEEMAEFMYSANDKICFDNCKKATGNKYNCKFGEDVMPIKKSDEIIRAKIKEKYGVSPEKIWVDGEV